MLKKLLFFSALLLCAAGTMHAQTCELTNLYVSRTGWVSWHSSCQDAEVRVVLSTLDGTTLADSLTTDTTMQLPTTALVDKTLYHLSVTQTLSPGQTVDCEWFYSSCSHLAMVTNAVAAPRPTGGVALRWDYPAITASAAEAPYAITMFDGYVTDPGAMSDGSDASWLKNYQSSFGPSVNKTTNSWVGFPVVLERPTTLSEIEVYAYQTGSTTTSTFTALYVRIYNGNPIENGTVIWGDADANIMTATAFTGCYRGSDGATTGMTRPIMSITASGLDIQLEPGTYWVTYALTGTESSGPWAVPHAVPGIGNTGNGVQFSSPKWIPLKDSYSESEIYYSPAFRIVGSMVPSAVGDTIGVAVFRNGRWLADVHGNSFVDPTGSVADHYSLRLLYGGDRLNRVGNAYYAMGCPNEVSFYHVDAMAAAYNPDEDDIHSPYMTVNWSDPIFFEDFESGDFSQYSWQLDATYPWSITTNSPHGGAYCMKSGCSGVDNANSDMTLEVDIDKDGEISFFAKISSESGWDKGHFYIDSVEKKEFSGECDWTESRFPIAAGHHTLRWSYSKDQDNFSGDDCLYIDDVKLTYTNQSKEIGWHSYCSYLNTAYKSTVSSTPKWGYEYAPEDLLDYKGWWMTKVSLFSDAMYNVVGGNYTCRVYVGGSNPEEGTLVTSLTVDVPQGQNAWLDWDLPTAVEVTGDDTIWVIWQVNTATSDYPAGGGNYSTKNSTNSGGWWDDGNGWKHLDIAWAMRQWFIPSTTPGAYSEQINKEELLTTPRKRDLEVQYELYRTDGITNTLLVTGLPDTTMSFVDSLWVGLPEGFYRFGVKVVGDTSILWSNILFHPAPIEHTVTALASSTAGGSVSGSGTFYYGTTATLTATPATCYHFTGWSNGLTSDTINITVKSDSTLTAIFERNAPLTGDTAAVACDQFTWYDTPFTSSTTTTHDLFTAEGCDSTVTLHLTVNYSTYGDTTAVVCDSFNWYNHTNLTSSTNTLTHLFTNAAGCDSTVTLDLTVNYSTTGDTTAVECDSFNWYDHTNLTSSTNTLTHLFPAGNQWNCDSTVTLDLTVHYSTTGDTTAVECDSFNWYDHTNLTSSTNTLTHLFPAGNQWNCDSTLTLHLTVHYSTTGDTAAVVYEPFTWYEHTALDSTQNVDHTFLGGNAMGCDSTVTLHLRYALFPTLWEGDSVVIYNSQSQTGLTASYVDDSNHTQTVTLTFTNQGTGATLAGYPVNAGRYTVTARPVLPVDSLADATRLMVVEPATLNVLGAEVVVAKLVDGNADAEVSNQGTLQNIQGNDNISHVTTATFDNANAGYDKVITLHYALTGTTQMLNNYTLGTTSEPYAELGAILEPMVPDTTGTGNDSTVADHGFDVYAYGYCTGSSYSLRYHLRSGNPDQYKIDFADIRFTDVDWTNLSITGAEGTIDIDVPVDLPTGDYTMTVTFRDSRFPWIESSPITASFHVNLPETFTKPIFDNVITIIDTCHCFSDIQWYHRANASDTWQAIPGATGYYYQEAGSLTGEYFVRAKMNGVETYTCPQTDMNTLVTETRQKVAINVWPNPTSESVNVNISNENPTHILRILNTVGLEMEHRTFDGESTRVDMSDYPRGSYMLSIDGIVVRVIRN